MISKTTVMLYNPHLYTGAGEEAGSFGGGAEGDEAGNFFSMYVVCVQ